MGLLATLVCGSGRLRGVGGSVAVCPEVDWGRSAIELCSRRCFISRPLDHGELDLPPRSRGDRDQPSRGLLVACLHTAAGWCMRSIRWQSPATASGTRWHARSPTTATRWCWPTSCAPTWPPTISAGRQRTGPGDRGVDPAQQDAVWDRTLAHNRLCSLLREFYPAIFAAVVGKRGGLLRPEAKAILAAAPTPTAAAGCPWPSCGRCSPELVGAAASMARHAGRVRSCAPAACTSRPSGGGDGPPAAGAAAPAGGRLH